MQSHKFREYDRKLTVNLDYVKWEVKTRLIIPSVKRFSLVVFVILVVIVVGGIQAVAATSAYITFEPQVLYAQQTLGEGAVPVSMVLTVTSGPVYIEQVELAFHVAYTVTAAGALLADHREIGCVGSLPAQTAGGVPGYAPYIYEYLPTCSPGQFVTDPLGNKALITSASVGAPSLDNTFLTGGSPPAGVNEWIVVILESPTATVTMTVYT